jgi:hypothetical protein
MADLKISALTASTTPLAGTEVLPIVQSSTTKQVSVANLTAGRAISATQLTLTTGNLIVASGQGIDFSATSGTGTSELLNDYEEGDFTPTVIGTTTAGSASYSRQTGRYTKVGRLVTFQIDLDWSSGTGTGNLAFAGLPFTSSSAVNTGVPANFVSNIALTALNYLQGWLPGSSTSITAMQSPVGGGAVSNVAYDAAGSVMLSGSYIV